MTNEEYQFQHKLTQWSRMNLAKPLLRILDERVKVSTNISNNPQLGLNRTIKVHKIGIKLQRFLDDISNLRMNSNEACKIEKMRLCATN